MDRKNLLKSVVIFAGGISLGYFLGVKAVKKEYQLDLAETKDFYMNKLNEFGVMPKEFEPEEVLEPSELTPEKGEDPATTLKAHTPKGRQIVKYNKPPLVYERPEEDEDDEYPDEDEADIEARADEFAARRHENRTKGLPYVIDHREYLDLPREYSKIDLYYYSTDRVLCEEDDTMIAADDEEILIGFDYEDVLDMQTNAWVRNDSILTAYQIHRIDDSYHETVEYASEEDRANVLSIRRRLAEEADNENI